MYARFISWQEATSAALRIFDPKSYHTPLHARMVPIALREAPVLQPRYPLLWALDGSGQGELIALRGLIDQREIPDLRGQSLGDLPLLLQAYPLRFEDHNRPTSPPGLDDLAPQKERDIGAYLVDGQGRPSPGAALKLAALEAFIEDHDLLLRFSKAAFGERQVEPIWLPPELIERHQLPHFYTLRAFPEDALLLRHIPQADWPLVMRFMVAQRASLHNMASLIAWAETFDAEAKS